MEQRRLVGAAALVAAIVGLGLLVRFDSDAPPAGQAIKTVGTAPAAAARPSPQTGGLQGGFQGNAAPPASVGAAAGPSAAPPPAPSVVPPGFDIVRVEPTGAAVIAGSAEAGSKVEILDGQTVLHTAEANRFGEWAAVLGKPLRPGTHDLALRTTSADGRTQILSEQRIAVAVPEAGSKDVLVVINEPNAPSRVLEKPEPNQRVANVAPPSPASPAGNRAAAPGIPPMPTQSPPTGGAGMQGPAVAGTGGLTSNGTQGAQPRPGGQPQAGGAGEIGRQAMIARGADGAPQPEAQAGAPQTGSASRGLPGVGSAGAGGLAPPAPAAGPSAVTVEAVEIDPDGTIFVAGSAGGQDPIRVYIENEFIGQAQPGPGGRWLLKAKKNLPVGRYAVRADRVEAGTGRVIVRVEVPFEREVDVAALRPLGAAGGATGAMTTAAVTEPQTVIIRKGDNLWSLSRRIYGQGVRYSTIYDANTGAIRNPRWIYPGQIFVLPDGNANWRN